ncbi:hypothetical protein SLS60_006000 [Paraconiothyrium brasiliense]|uniref:Uncharacterized protein n=1 Tax=Paraconiothyrium brasiliense TaxID=300254 RepID=A0ABR3RDT0_9PLEO
MAGPVAPFDNEASASLLTKRGIDFCPSHGTREVGQPCPFGSGGDGTPHACGKVNPAAIGFLYSYEVAID